MASAPTPDRAVSSCTGTDACRPGPDTEQHPGRHDHTHEGGSCHSSHHA
ncbi:hypothetical protein [Microbispora sp. GKU 823]|nr:hypothetical protein [Microbispora sp. GKU 823]